MLAHAYTAPCAEMLLTWSGSPPYAHEGSPLLTPGSADSADGLLAAAAASDNSPSSPLPSVSEEEPSVHSTRDGRSVHGMASSTLFYTRSLSTSLVLDCAVLPALAVVLDLPQLCWSPVLAAISKSTLLFALRAHASSISYRHAWGMSGYESGEYVKLKISIDCQMLRVLRIGTAGGGFSGQPAPEEREDSHAKQRPPGGSPEAGAAWRQLPASRPDPGQALTLVWASPPAFRGVKKKLCRRAMLWGLPLGSPFVRGPPSPQGAFLPDERGLLHDCPLPILRALHSE